MNVCFEYFYRDSGNFKTFGDVVFQNKQGLNVSDVEEEIRQNLIDQQFFYTEEIQIESLLTPEAVTDVDPTWHEFQSLTETDQKVNDIANRDICDVIKLLSDG